MHFLKSEKPIHLGQTREEEEGVKRKTSKLVFFTPCQSSSVIHKLSKHFVSPSLIVTCLDYNQSWRDGSSAIPSCLVLHVDKSTNDKVCTDSLTVSSGGKISYRRKKRAELCLCILMDWINLCFSGTVLFRHSGTVVYLHLLSNRFQAFSGARQITSVINHSFLCSRALERLLHGQDVWSRSTFITHVNNMYKV